MSILDKKKGRELGKAGEKLVTEHASEEWLEMAYNYGIQVAQDREVFTTDQIWGAMADDPLKDAVHNPSAMCAVTKDLIRSGFAVIIPKEFERSSRPAAHCRPMQKYRSLIVGKSIVIKKKIRVRTKIAEDQLGLFGDTKDEFNYPD